MELMLQLAYIFIPLIILILIGIPVAFSFGLVGIFLIVRLQGLKGLVLLMLGVYGHSVSFVLVAVPLFILMAEVILFSGVSADLFKCGNKWLGRVPGGIPIATMASCSLFAAVTGSSVANASTIGLVSIPEMVKSKVDKSLAAGVIAAGGTLGILIPPSLLFILYGVLTEESVGQLFIAGVIPGIILTLIFMISIAIRVYRNPDLAPPAPKVSLQEKINSTISIWPILMLILLVLGTIYAGICTPTESAAMGAAGSVLVAAIKRTLTLANFRKAIFATVRTTCMALWILLGATAFAAALDYSGIPDRIIRVIANLDLYPLLLIICMNVILLILGCFMESMGILMLVTPIFVPIIQQLGFSPIWWGVVFCINMELALISPPVGYNLFVIQGIAPDIPLKDIYRGVLPFILVLIITLAIIIVFPQTATWLPTTIYK